MALDDQAVIAFLSHAYPGPVSTRALWLWAGGEAAQIEYFHDPVQQWQQLWGLARSGVAAPPAALLREALFDRPGNPDLLGFLAAWVVETFAAGPNAAKVLAAQLDRLAPEFDLKRLWPVLAGFPDRGILEAFAALSVALQGRLPPPATPAPPSEPSENDQQPDPPPEEGEDSTDTDGPAPRAALETQLQQLIASSPAPKPAELAAAILFLRDTLPDVFTGPPLSDWDRLCQDMEDLLGADELDADVLGKKVPPLLAQLPQLAPETERDLVEEAAASMDKQLACLLALLKENAPPGVAVIGEACIQALWGTTAV